MKKFNQTLKEISESRKQILDADPRKPFATYEEHSKTTNIRNQLLNGMQAKSCLDQEFFSQENINVLQKLIRNEVLKQTDGKHKIDNQSETELVIIMRSIFLQNSLNQKCNIKQQVNNLNSIVIKEAVPIILTAIEQYFGYVKDASSMPLPMEQPKNVSNAGTKTYDLTTPFKR